MNLEFSVYTELMGLHHKNELNYGSEYEVANLYEL